MTAVLILAAEMLLVGCLAPGSRTGPNVDGTRLLRTAVYDETTWEWDVLNGTRREIEKHTFDLRQVDDFEASDETGRIAEWAALLARRRDTRFHNFYYVLLDGESGCPRAAGNEERHQGYAYGNLVSDTTSRITKPMLGAWHAVPSMRGLGPLLVQLGAIADANRGDLRAALRGFAPNATADEEGTGIALQLGAWQLRFEYGPAGRPYPTAITWENGEGGGGLVLDDVEFAPSGRVGPLSCDRAWPWEAPRATLRTMTGEGLLAEHGPPPEYPMRDAHDDARLLPAVSEFFARHPDARFSQLWPYYEYPVGQPPMPPPGTHETTWVIHFASPADQVGIEVHVHRTTIEAANETVPGQVLAGDEYHLAPGFPEKPPWASSPLIDAGAALSLHAQAGLPAPNRLGWIEAANLARQPSVWSVEYYHPYYGADIGATRSGYWFDATSGWVVFSAVNSAPYPWPRETP